MVTHIENLDLEQERRDALANLIAEHGEDWLKEYEPSSFGCHELLDRTALVADLLERSVLWHPASIQNPEWFRLAERAVALLQDLYQRIGEAHLEDEDDAEK